MLWPGWSALLPGAASRAGRGPDRRAAPGRRSAARRRPRARAALLLAHAHVRGAARSPGRWAAVACRPGRSTAPGATGATRPGRSRRARSRAGSRRSRARLSSAGTTTTARRSAKFGSRTTSPSFPVRLRPTKPCAIYRLPGTRKVGRGRFGMPSEASYLPVFAARAGKKQGDRSLEHVWRRAGQPAGR
jgi:hypothetical protein